MEFGSPRTLNFAIWVLRCVLRVLCVEVLLFGLMVLKLMFWTVEMINGVTTVACAVPMAVAAVARCLGVYGSRKSNSINLMEFII